MITMLPKKTLTMMIMMILCRSFFGKPPAKKTAAGAAGAESKENPAKTKDSAKRKSG